MDTFLTILAILAGIGLFIFLSVKIPGFAAGFFSFVIGYLKWSWRVASAVVRAFKPR